MDNILILSEGNKTEHEKLVERVLKMLDDKNLALKISKGEFFKQQVDWFGHLFSESGVRPKFTKTEAIQNLIPPKLLKNSRSFMGSTNQLEKFIPNAASSRRKLRPLPKERAKRKS